MADEIIDIKVSELPQAATLDDLEILGIDRSTNKSVRALMSLLRGLDGKNIELQKTLTHIQWRIVGGSWTNLVALEELKGVKGDPGNPVEFQKSATHVQWRVQGTTTWNNLITLDELKVKGDTGASIEMQVSSTHIQWRVQGTTTWNNLMALSELEGDPGKNIELQKTSTHIQWRIVGGSWANLVALSELKGAQGDNIELQKTATHVQWRVVGGAWNNLIALSELKGNTGPTPIISTGTVATIPPGGQSSAELVDDGVDENGVKKYKLNLTLVRGDTGTIDNIDTVTIVFTESEARQNINTGDTISVLFGKIRKWFSDLKSLAFKDKVNWNTDVDNRPTSMPASDVPAWAKAATKPTYSASETGSLPESHNTDGSSHADIRSEVASVRLVAEGALVGYAFDTVAAMNSWIAISANKAKLKVGNSLFIRALDVPDYWWDGTQALAVESQKIDLSGYLLSSVAANTYVAKESGKSLMTDAERTKLNGIAPNANDYVHPTGSGNNHVPAGGASGQILRYSVAGTAEWGEENNTTYSPATQSANGLMSKDDKTKLDGLKFEVVASLPSSPDSSTFYFITE